MRYTEHHQRMLKRILLTNDDGIDAPGIAVAAEVAAQLAEEVWVAAPADDCSGRGQQVSLHDPLRLSWRDDRNVAVQGSPVDSVIVGLRHLLRDNPPDLVLSGINAGHNHSKEVGYSGTVGAALTARMLGVPAIALSQGWVTRDDVPWDTSRHWLPRVLSTIIEQKLYLNPHILNINLPGIDADGVTGVRTTRIGSGLSLDIDVDRRVDNRNKEYFWLKFAREAREDAADTDVAALRANAISVTPLGRDATAREAFADLKHMDW